MPLLSAAALWVSLFVSVRRNCRLRPDDAWLAAGLGVFAEIVISMMALGAVHALRPLPARLACATWLVLHVVLAALAPRAKGRRPRWSWTRLRLILPWPLWLAAAATLSTLAFQTRLAFGLPALSWDGLSYHLPIVHRWISQGDLSLEGWAGPHRYFPWNGNLVMAFLALLDSGRMAWTHVAQLLALPLMAGAGAVLGRRLAGPAWAWACALALASLPIALIHAGIPYVDLFYSSFWLAAAAAALGYERTESPLHLLLYALAFGLALGTKATLYFQLPLLIPPLWTWTRDPERRRAALRLLPALAAVVLAVGGITYLRNWAASGNPIFPYTFRLGGLTIFKGITEPGELLVSVEKWFVSSPAAWLWYPFRETIKGVPGYSAENGFGPLFAAAWALFPASAWLMWRRQPKMRSFLTLLPASILMFLALHPTREPRYVIYLAGVPIVALAAALRQARGPARALALAGWTLGLLWNCCGTLARTGGDDALWRAREDLRAAGRVDALVHYRRQYGALGEAWAALNERLQAGDAVAVNYGELIHPWSGVPPRARVVVVNRSPNDYPGAFHAAEPERWLELLERLKVRYVVNWSPAWYPETGTAEREALALFPKRFAALGQWRSSDFGTVELFDLKPRHGERP